MAMTVAARDIGINKVGSEMEGQAGWASQSPPAAAAITPQNTTGESVPKKPRGSRKVPQCNGSARGKAVQRSPRLH